MTRSVAAPSGADGWSFCQISWRRGYASCAFIAVCQDDEPKEIGKSPQFRWRIGSPSPPEVPEVVSCLVALREELECAGWELIEEDRSSWYAMRFRRLMIPLSERIGAYGGSAEPLLFATAASTALPLGTAAREALRLDAERLEAERLEAERREAERLEAERREAERLEAERREAERLEAERREAERLEAERLEAERLEAERREAERLEAERLEAERREAERLEAERLEAERLEAERLEAERLEAERLEAERLEAERLRAARKEAERLAGRITVARTPEDEVDELEPVSGRAPTTASRHGTALNSGQTAGVLLRERIGAYSYVAKHDPRVDIRALFREVKYQPRSRRSVR